MISVFETMGTLVTIEPPLRVRELEAIFAGFDERFSLYRPTSELSRIADGSLNLVDTNAVIRDTYAIALEWHHKTRGWFTPHRPDGVIDVSGVVKALAMEAAARLLGDDDAWILNAGGDVLTSGRATAVAIVDPFDRKQLLTAVTIDGTRRAIATSGTSERGEHIWGRGGFVQVSVIADDIVTADVLATTIAAGGLPALDHSTSRWDIDVLAIDPEGNLFATPGLRGRISSAAALAN